MEPKISINSHSSIRVQAEKTLWFDPYQVEEETHDADLVLITHPHFDHFSPDDIAKVSKPDTLFIMPFGCAEAAEKAGLSKDRTVLMSVRDSVNIAGVSIESLPAYNIGKPFHPEENKWIGYIAELGGKGIYVAGDTDALDENIFNGCDIALVPVGGKYTMNAEEAADFIDRLHPSEAIPTHYGTVVGDPGDGETFKRLVKGDIRVSVLI